MKKILLFVAALGLFNSVTASAQVKSYIGLYSGLSSPLSDYASSDYYNDKAGFAKKGMVTGLEAAIYIHKNLAIQGTMSFQDQGQLSDDDASYISAGYTASYDARGSTVTAQNRYQNFNLLLGPQYSFIFGNLVWDLKASAGFIKNFTTPQIETDVTTGAYVTTTETFTQLSTHSSTLAYGAGTSLRYNLSDSIGLSLRYSYINSDGLEIAYDSRTTQTGRYITKQPIAETQASIGINVSF